MFCCKTDQCNLSEQFDFTINNTKEGIIIDVKPKDKSKVDSLQKLAEAYKDFCDGNCC